MPALMTVRGILAPLLDAEAPDEPAPTPIVVARGAGHDLSTLREAEAVGATVGAAVRVAHRRLEVGPARRGPLDRRPRLTLDELLAASRPGTQLMLDLRGVDPRLPRLLARSLAAGPVRQVLLCSRTWWLLEPLRHRPGVRVLPTIGSARHLAMLMRRCDTEPLDGVVVAANLLSRRTAAALTAMAETVLTWPVDSPAEAQRLQRLGVSGLITDEPAIALAAPVMLAA